jgi:hypothetical protein
MKGYVVKHNGKACHPFKPHVISIKSKNMLQKINEVTDINTKLELLKLYSDMMIDACKVLYNRFDPHMMYMFNNEIHLVFNYNDDGVFLYDGNIHKLLSVICSYVTLEINKRLPYDAFFEATFTAFNIDYEILNFLIWRQYDCKRNVSSLLYKCLLHGVQNLGDSVCIDKDVLHHTPLSDIENILALHGYECPEFTRGTILKKKLIQNEKEIEPSTRTSFIVQHHQFDVDFSNYFNNYIDKKCLKIFFTQLLVTMNSPKTISTIFFEAVVVGAGLVALVFILQAIPALKPLSLPLLLFIAGALFHVICEYTGVNQWYSVKYCNLLNK